MIRICFILYAEWQQRIALYLSKQLTIIVMSAETVKQTRKINSSVA